MTEETTIETTQTLEETTSPVTEPIEETTSFVTDPVEETSFPEVTEEHEISDILDYLPSEETVLETHPEVYQETTEVITVDLIETATSNIVHASLFGSFLVCGTLVGIFLLRGRYGN